MTNSQSTSEPERRRYPRILTDIEVEFDCMGIKTQEKAIVLSGGGMFVVTERAELVESDVSLKFRPSPTSPVISARGKVCYVVPRVGMGIEFSDVREEDRQHILKLIASQSGERRTSKRVSLVAQVRKIEPKEMAVGYSKDVSVGGMFIETEDPLAAGEQALIRFKLYPDGPILESRAEIVYGIERQGMAVRFVGLPAETREQIQRFIDEQG